MSHSSASHGVLHDNPISPAIPRKPKSPDKDLNQTFDQNLINSTEIDGLNSNSTTTNQFSPEENAKATAEETENDEVDMDSSQVSQTRQEMNIALNQPSLIFVDEQNNFSTGQDTTTNNNFYTTTIKENNQKTKKNLLLENQKAQKNLLLEKEKIQKKNNTIKDKTPLMSEILSGPITGSSNKNPIIGKIDSRNNKWYNEYKTLVQKLKQGENLTIEEESTYQTLLNINIYVNTIGKEKWLSMLGRLNKPKDDFILDCVEELSNRIDRKYNLKLEVQQGLESISGIELYEAAREYFEENLAKQLKVEKEQLNIDQITFEKEKELNQQNTLSIKTEIDLITQEAYKTNELTKKQEMTEKSNKLKQDLVILSQEKQDIIRKIKNLIKLQEEIEIFIELSDNKLFSVSISSKDFLYLELNHSYNMKLNFIQKQPSFDIVGYLENLVEKYNEIPYKTGIIPIKPMKYDSDCVAIFELKHKATNRNPDGLLDIHFNKPILYSKTATEKIQVQLRNSTNKGINQTPIEYKILKRSETISQRSPYRIESDNIASSYYLIEFKGTQIPNIRNQLDWSSKLTIVSDFKFCTYCKAIGHVIHSCEKRGCKTCQSKTHLTFEHNKHIPSKYLKESNNYKPNATTTFSNDNKDQNSEKEWTQITGTRKHQPPQTKTFDFQTNSFEILKHKGSQDTNQDDSSESSFSVKSSIQEGISPKRVVKTRPFQRPNKKSRPMTNQEIDKFLDSHIQKVNQEREELQLSSNINEVTKTKTNSDGNKTLNNRTNSNISVQNPELNNTSASIQNSDHSRDSTISNNKVSNITTDQSNNLTDSNTNEEVTPPDPGRVSQTSSNSVINNLSL
ncbi:uncharacterized protein KGF55_001632 [Candida pseudojiufengensis]|uniref:uncharacterized protein n=1 Tax=Candida pseudojiufengensis TaxID=497109 RepID=UPI0022253A18|nr:uncharacterized protein KGF55_001632 [Candida pseudojiufengensis]KAI5964563.1 hypothetical protein KGF55_001632 [Candida pseudojiufengensis]